MPARGTIGKESVKDMKISVIATGSSTGERYIRHWGVAFLLGEDVLFDTFGDPVFLARALKKMRVDTARLKHIIISHDDWDHINGLWQLIAARKDVAVYICPGFKREIKDRIASFGVRLIEAAEPTMITNAVHTGGELYGESGGRKIYEQSVIVKTGDGIAVLCGCAHPGVVNIVTRVKTHFPGRIKALIGGFHLKDKTAAEIQDIIENLRSLRVEAIAPMHCTGPLATRMFKQEYGKAFIRVRQGSVFEV